MMAMTMILASALAWVSSVEAVRVPHARGGVSQNKVQPQVHAAAGVPSSLPPPDDSDPVHVFSQGGQSECVGQASAQLLNQDNTWLAKPFKGVQEGAWLAGVAGQGEDNFFIAPLEAGVPSDRFGVEIGFATRYREATGARVLVIKYCVGGTNVRKHWNPDDSANTWNYEADNKTAAWLSAKTNLQWGGNGLFKTHVYVIRRTIEALKAANVAFEWKGIVWDQGSADRKFLTAEEFGQKTARLFDAFRELAIGIPDLPIVDTGANQQHLLMSGKAYARQITKGCNVVNVEHAAAVEDPDSTCVIGPSNPCSESTIFNVDFHNLYGWDPLLPASIRPSGANDKVFRWYKSYPTNLHSEYGGMLLKGLMLADAFIDKFSPFELTRSMRNQDPAIRFPFSKCAAGQRPSSNTFCWLDQRPTVAECVPQV